MKVAERAAVSPTVWRHSKIPGLQHWTYTQTGFKPGVKMLCYRDAGRFWHERGKRKRIATVGQRGRGDGRHTGLEMREWMVLHTRPFPSRTENCPEGGCETPTLIDIILLWPYAYLLVQSFRVGQNLLNIQVLSQSSSGLPAQGLPR